MLISLFMQALYVSILKVAYIYCFKFSLQIVAMKWMTHISSIIVILLSLTQ